MSPRPRLAPRLAFVASLAAATLAPTVASAQQSSAEIAQAHYARGNQLFAGGRYAESAAEFDFAWRVSQRPELLFNLARACEAGGMYERALDAYERFERAGSPGYDRTALTLRIDAMHARVSAQQAQAQAQRQAQQQQVAVRPPPPVTVAAPSRNFTVPIVLLSAGGAALLGAVPLWVSALGVSHDLEVACPGHQCAHNEDLARRDSAQTRALLGDVLGGVGVASLIAGAVVLGLTLASHPEPAPTRSASFVCTGDGCVGSMRFAF